MSRVILDDRLKAAADFVRQGAYFADIGTDHAYLPVFLLEEGRIRHAYASDVARGPVLAAEAHIAASSVGDRITLRLADGLQGLPNDAPDVTDIAVCGMGGELIVRLIDDAPFVKKSGIRLILQPMSRANILRRYLAKNGFLIEKETLSCADGRIYTCMCVSYTGTPHEISDLEAALGKAHLSAVRTPIFHDYVAEKLRSAEKKLLGMKRGGLDTAEEEAFADALRRILNEMERKV